MPCRGINHADFTADETLMLASCEFSGQLVVIDVAARRVRAVIDLANGVTRRKGLRRAMPKDRSMPSGMRHDSMEHDLMRHGRLEHDSMEHDSMDHDSMHGRMPYPNMPQDVKLSPDGTTFYIADMAKNGVWVVDAGKFRVTGFIPTGAGAHGLYVSRDSKVLYVSNRGAGSVSVISFALGRPIATWPIPGGGSPDMGGVSADGPACGCPDVTTGSSTCSTPAPVASSVRSTSARARTAWPSTPSPDATRSGTRESSVEARRRPPGDRLPLCPG